MILAEGGADGGEHFYIYLNAHRLAGLDGWHEGKRPHEGESPK